MMTEGSKVFNIKPELIEPNNELCAVFNGKLIINMQMQRITNYFVKNESQMHAIFKFKII